MFLGYGSPEYVGLGFSVMVALVFIELFGSIFMKNCNVIIALLFGYFVAGVSRYEDDDGNSLRKLKTTKVAALRTSEHRWMIRLSYNADTLFPILSFSSTEYVTSDKIKAADPITFLWTSTFPIGFYGPAVIPLLIAYLVTTVETVGDLTAVFEVSDLDVESEEYTESIQGGLFADAICSILSGLCTTLPNTTFSQNNGVIALTKCAARRAGYACGFWLILLGVLSKIAGVITSIPDCVLGGMTIFLFANVLASGIALAGSIDLHSRRNKFIMAMSLAVGVGVTVWPFAFQDPRASSYTANFWTCEDCSTTLKGVRNGISIFLSTGYCVGTVFAMLLNALLPEDAEISYMDADITTRTKKADGEDEVDVKKEESSDEETPANAGSNEAEA